jgi:hypothetical protein
VATEVHGREKSTQRRQIGKMADGAADGGTPVLVLTPNVVYRLAGDRDPAAGFA